MWLTSSSIGRKLIMAITGAFLILFLTFHVLMNAVAICWPAAYNMVCEFLGANWYALVGTLVLAAGFILHILYALWLTVQNRRARGSERYEVTSRPPQVEWSSKNMLVLGIVVLAFLCVHLIQFWAKMQLAEVMHLNVVDPATGESVPAAAGTWFLQMAFKNPLTLPIYLIGFAALWFHLTHGFWSMFQSTGWNGKIWIKRLKCIGNVWVSAVVLLFAVEAIVFTVQANRGVYTSCPVLLEQYEEMAAAEGAEAAQCTAMTCTEDAAEGCTEACAAKEACCSGQEACAEGAECAEGACNDKCTCTVTENCGKPQCASTINEEVIENQATSNM